MTQKTAEDSTVEMSSGVNLTSFNSLLKQTTQSLDRAISNSVVSLLPATPHNDEHNFVESIKTLQNEPRRERVGGTSLPNPKFNLNSYKKYTRNTHNRLNNSGEKDSMHTETVNSQRRIDLSTPVVNNNHFRSVFEEDSGEYHTIDQQYPATSYNTSDRQS